MLLLKGFKIPLETPNTLKHYKSKDEKDLWGESSQSIARFSIQVLFHSTALEILNLQRFSKSLDDMV